MDPYILIVISACLYIVMILSHGILPKSLVPWAPFTACLVFGLSAYVLGDHSYIGGLQITAIITPLISVVCAVEIWWVLRMQYVAGIHILVTESSYLMKVAFAGCTSMLVALTALFLPLVW